MAGAKYDALLRTKDHLRTRDDGGGGSGTIPGVFRFRGTFDIANPLTAEYPKNTAGVAVNATQVGDGSGMPGPFVQNGDAWIVIGGGGKVGPTGKQTTDGNMIVAIVDNATNLDADWVILETEENDLIDTTYANALTLITDSALIPGNMYRITDRYNCVIQALDTASLSQYGIMTVPNGTTPDMIQDEVIQVQYEILSDTILGYKDRFQNEILWANIVFVNFSTYLIQVAFAFAFNTLNIFSSAPTFTAFIGTNTNNIYNGLLFQSNGSYSSNNNIGLGSSYVLGNNAFGSGNTIGSASQGTFTDNSLGFNNTALSNASVQGANNCILQNNIALSSGLLVSDNGIASNNNIRNGSAVFISANAVVASCEFADNVVIAIAGNVTMTGCTIKQISTSITLGTYSNKILESGRSTFDFTLDVDGLANPNELDLTIYDYVGVVYLYSSLANPTYQLNTIIITQTNHTVQIRPQGGLVININGVNKATPPLADEVLVEGPSGLYSFDGDYDEYIEVKKTGNIRTSKISGVQYN